MTAHRLITAALVGVVAALAIAAVRAKSALDTTQAQGFTATVGGISMHIAPPNGAGSGGKTVTLPPDAAAALDNMAPVAAGAAIVVGVVAFLVTKP